MTMIKKSNFKPEDIDKRLKAVIEAQRILRNMNKRKKPNRKKLTRAEMWRAITSKYPSLNCFFIDRYGRDTPYYYHKKREQLFNIIMEMNIHKSRHLTKKQKQKVEYELNEKAFDKI